MSDEKDYPMDLEILVGFVDEATEGICKAMDDILAIGRKGYDDSLVQSVFRVFHSIKGNSAFFGLFPIKDLSHTLEQILDKLRKKELVPDHDVVDTLLDAASILNTCFSMVRTGGIHAIHESDVSSAIDTLHNLLEQKLDISSILHSIMEDLHQIERKEKTPAQVVARLSRFIDSEKSKPGTDKTGDHSKRQYPTYLQSLVSLLMNPAKGILSEDQCDDLERNLMSLDESFHDAPRKKLLEEVTTDFYIYRKSVGLDPLLREALLDKLALFPEESLPCIPEQDLPSEETSQPGPSKTMRVSEASVDQFLSYVGELVVVEEMYASLELQMLEGKLSIRDITAALRKTTEIFKGLSRQLQRSIMEIRKVPISNLFQRMPKIVHDVAKEKNKDIEIKIENGHLLVDKNLVEKMEAPLMHMVRNAADHGIEPPAVRVSQGKPELGTIVLTAEEVGETIRVTIVDDGAGLNLEKIRERALELGILDPQATLSEQRIIDVMFHSGVSTADEVSDISGRGVGMDVVKKNIDEAGGSIRTSTTAGKGTTFTLTLPSSVTTQIIQGFIVRAGSKRCIIPLDTVSSSLSYSSANISSVKGRQQVLNHNNHLIPVSRLRNLIDPDFSHGETQNDNTGIIVVTQAGGMEKAYVVDAVEGIRQVVVKPIHKVGGCEARVMSGGAVMGDGTVALILDMEKIMRFED